MPHTFRLALVVCVLALLAAACSGNAGAASTTSTDAGAASTTSTDAGAASTTSTDAGAASTTSTDAGAASTTSTDAGASTLTFTGTECIQAGPSEVGTFVQFALRNDASTGVVMMFVKLTDSSLEDLVSDDERFPPIDQWPPTVGHKDTETVTHKVVESGEDLSHAVSFNEPGEYGTFCYPLDGTPPIPGGLLTAEA